MNIMASPRSLDIEITNKCNLRCKYCSHFESAAEVKKDLELEEWLLFFEELNHTNVMDVVLCGGEPFLKEDLKEIIDGIVKNRMRFQILSNGTLITPDISLFLAETGRCNSVQVSIDGSQSETHDFARGSGSFSKAIEGIKNLKKYNVPIAVRVTIHKKNVRDIERIAKLLFEDLGLNSFSTNSASYMGLCRRNSEAIQLDIEEQSYAMETLLRLNKKYKGRINAAAGPLANARMWLFMERMLKERLPEEKVSNGGYLVGCGGTLNRIAVRADGVIVPCIQISHIELGKINRDNLSEIWQNHSKLKELRERRNIPLKEFEFCRGCNYINYCTGNCPALSYTLTGDIFHPSPDACLKRFLEKGGRLPEEKLLQV